MEEEEKLSKQGGKKKFQVKGSLWINKRNSGVQLFGESLANFHYCVESNFIKFNSLFILQHYLRSPFCNRNLKNVIGSKFSSAVSILGPLRPRPRVLFASD